jgi:hypothetical protein
MLMSRFDGRVKIIFISSQKKRGEGEFGDVAIDFDLDCLTCAKSRGCHPKCSLTPSQA